MWQTPGVNRIESQLLMLSDAANRRVPLSELATILPAIFSRSPFACATARAQTFFHHLHQSLDRSLAGSHRTPDCGRISEPHRQPDQRSIPFRDRRPPLPHQHRAVSRLRLLLRPRLLRSRRGRSAMRSLAGQPGLRRTSATSRRFASRPPFRERASATNWCGDPWNPLPSTAAAPSA